MISQFFILSPRGDTIIYKDFRGDGFPNMQDEFFRRVKFWERNDAPPVIQFDGFSYIYIRRSSLLMVITTKFNVSPASSIELLNRMGKVFKDYCGILTEESIRKNFILIYELLEEMLDYGYPQITSTEMLKNCVHNEAVLVTTPSISSTIMSNVISQSKTKASSASNVPITLKTARGGNTKNEIYVDIIERLTVLFNANGYVVNSCIDGSINMKSFLSGNPELRLALNEDLIIGKQNAGLTNSVVLDDCIFHECVHLDEFEHGRTLHFLPPDGEFAVVSYRVTSDFRVPFKLYPTIEELPGGYKFEVTIILRAEIPEGNYGSNIVLRLPVPRSTVHATCEFAGNASDLPGCTSEYAAQEKKIVWNIRKLVGGSEIILKAKITVDNNATAPNNANNTSTSSTTCSNNASNSSNTTNLMLKKEIGPVSMSFEIPMYNVSNLQVRYLRISETHKAYNPYRWVRYITQSSSYVSRF